MTTTTFKDHFSRYSADYNRCQPGYPADLIEWVASRAPDRRLAVEREPATSWPVAGTLRLNWPIHLRLGRN